MPVPSISIWVRSWRNQINKRIQSCDCILLGRRETYKKRDGSNSTSQQHNGLMSHRYDRLSNKCKSSFCPDFTQQRLKPRRTTEWDQLNYWCSFSCKNKNKNGRKADSNNLGAAHYLITCIESPYWELRRITICSLSSQKLQKFSCFPILIKQRKWHV